MVLMIPADSLFAVLWYMFRGPEGSCFVDFVSRCTGRPSCRRLGLYALYVFHAHASSIYNANVAGRAVCTSH